ncbi:L-threonylcarbamoyladenylate synthase [Pectobacterium carotovorum]|uniref:L-threonylcarbamoyladenylate synthase n=1 Tax=Pectobacterium carotovorum TaxID=554 RepID=UPI00057D008E|nr:Sua5/YciO/YrdC/YwlC family protein [Pectobacterium carotovorum]KHT16788.1 translation factor (SUA5) [Pectobacterium carotovorum subsp. carotovorum]MBA0194541.1 Sua5/YciO/YrdC/YwlC family protein [Pectobacterium carotovorum]RJL46360.1 translation factor (SUA5) [Pectobacterium carotovorum]
MNRSKVHWNGGLHDDAVQIMSRGGGIIVSPTKVGYIIMASDKAGLERKFDAKQRNRNKPGVVLCGSIAQLKVLAQLNPEIEQLYQRHWDTDVLLGCILPWHDSALARIPKDGSKALMMDDRKTSCFVIKFGKPSEILTQELWERYGKLIFASSANPSGKGNRGEVEGIGERISAFADLIIEADDYVKSIQPNKSHDTRYEQGVMVSMVDTEGQLVPEQKGRRSVYPCPTLIRKGLDVDKVMSLLSDTFTTWDYRHGDYY